MSKFNLDTDFCRQVYRIIWNGRRRMSKQKAFEIALELNKIAMSLDINTLKSLEPSFKRIEKLLSDEVNDDSTDDCR